MRKIKVTRWRLALAVLAVVAGLGFMAEPAQAQPDSVTVTNECNSGSHSGYSLVGTHDMLGPTGGKRGTYEVYWNGTYNCGIARCYTNCGQSLWRWAAIADEDGSGWDDTDGPGYWTYYAGPVYSGNAVGECIDIRAWFATAADPNANQFVAQVWLQNIHCD